MSQPPSTFSLQQSLPRLPVPELQATLARYLRSVAPLLSAEEFQKTALAVLAFAAPGGPGAELQARLRQRAADKGDRCGSCHTVADF